MPSYCTVRSSSQPTTSAMRGSCRRFRHLRVEPRVSKTSSAASDTANPTSAACGPPSTDTEASIASRCRRMNETSCSTSIAKSLEPIPVGRPSRWPTDARDRPPTTRPTGIGSRPELRFRCHRQAPWVGVSFLRHHPPSETRMSNALAPPNGRVCWISRDGLERTVEASRLSARKRMIQPFHRTEHAGLHRMFNAVQPGSYIAPHRHLDPPKDESWIVLQGALVFFTFDESGNIETCR